MHVASILEGRVVGIRGGGGVAGGAFSTVRARQAITLDACRPPLFSYRSRGPPAALLNTASPPHPISTLSWRRAEPKTLTLPSLPRIEGCDYARHRFKCTLFPPSFSFLLIFSCFQSGKKRVFVYSLSSIRRLINKVLFLESVFCQIVDEYFLETELYLRNVYERTCSLKRNETRRQRNIFENC